MSEDLEVIQVIRTRLKVRGNGSDSNPVRIVEQYWDMSGNILWEIDPFPGDRGKP